MGKYYSMTCPLCGGQIERQVGYGVMEMRQMEARGEKPSQNIDYDEPLRCPHCGKEIDPADDNLFGVVDSVVAFFD